MRIFVLITLLFFKRYRRYELLQMSASGHRTKQRLRKPTTKTVYTAIACIMKLSEAFEWVPCGNKSPGEGRKGPRSTRTSRRRDIKQHQNKSNERKTGKEKQANNINHFHIDNPLFNATEPERNV